ncbi:MULTISPECIES: OmpH family outer membrane protein [Halomonadaceae]|uniref:OmpH family outer membrane protein n=1 Tax=Vreelandella janggokensis TaxID=370767 RepID=A0ABT4IRE3_9GAMM|nr:MULTISPECIES: OmpH family outer membrane protein [Halomonas]MCW4150150.1 OmpH family outer membrane protein [Halomonas sp. 18H]MCZ0926235.1 OmpH family outer membrane protein [Halomonas janggokensis]MCZ0931302.1 OmpH family outer membrane protein [Halomonas janggokensis]MDR5887664.1 OmpH family outer membrane protein [Halomonas janggokensis]QPL46713.1 OmpH family outer membrane protein [Halomonas sp. A40-4]
MLKLTRVVCLLGAMVLSAQAQADEVAVLDWRAALMNSDSAQSSISRLESEIGNQQREAESLGSELQGLQERLQTEGETMSEAQRESLIAELQEKGRRFEQLRQQIGQAQQRSEQQFLEGAEAKLEQAVEQVIDRHGIEVLVEPQGVLHSSRDLPNVTDEVTQIFNSLN